MSEPAALTSARRHLAQAEREYRTADGLFHLEEGLALLEDVVLNGEEVHRRVATNLLATYSGKICDKVKKLIDTDSALPEPELRHAFDVLLAFDAVELDLPPFVRPLKIEVVKRVIDLNYEGHSETEKRKMMAELADLAE